jgi:hypothetical protein
MRSPAPDRFSPAFWEVDFWESGVTVDVLVSGDGGTEGIREGRTLLGGLLAESLAKSVRHDDGWLVVVVGCWWSRV